MLLYPTLLLSLTPLLAAAAQVPDTAPGVLQFDFGVHRTDEALLPRNIERRQFLERRGNTARDDKFFSATLGNMFTYYNLSISLGTPAQDLHVLIDTGSSDLWVIDKDNKYCAKSQSQLAGSSYGSSSNKYIDCSISGTFDASASSTYRRNNSDFYIKYGDGTIAKGDWATDTFQVAGTTVKQMSFGLGNLTDSSVSILGVGYASNEASAGIKGSPYTYSNLPLKLVEQGTIHTPAYSLWLNDIYAQSGSILFGGVDHAKYEPPLYKVPVLAGSRGSSSSSSSPTAFIVALNDLTLSGFDSLGQSEAASVLSSPIYALLDSGTSLSYFPQDVANSILKDQLQAAYSSNLGYYYQSCNLQGQLSYNFSGATINVPFSNFLFPLSDRQGNPATSRSGEPLCAIGILPFGSSFALLGDTFLRDAYVVYDLKNNEIAIAQAKLNVTDSAVEAIVSTIPSATAAPLYSATNVAGGYSSASFSDRVGSIYASESATDIAFSGNTRPGASATGNTGGASANSATTTTTSAHHNSASSSARVPAVSYIVMFMSASLALSAGCFCVLF